MWQMGRSKSFFLLLAVLLSLSSVFCWADGLTDQELEELLTLLETQETEINNLDQDLSEAKILQNGLEIELKALKGIQQTQDQLIDALEKSLKTLKPDRKIKIEIGGFYTVDSTPGIYAGISIEFP